MWSYITSFFNNYNTDDLSLEGACNVLKSADEVKTTPKVHVDIKSSNVFSNRIGIISHMTLKKYVIDGLHVFDKNDNSFQLGTKVCYDLIVSEGKERVVNATAVDSEWDVSQVEDCQWNTRIIICKVEKRVDRKLYLSPGELVVDMNITSLEFLPLVGDWLEVDVKCTINENVLDLSGKVIEINKISPVRCHIETCKITSWNSEQYTGMATKNIFFNRDSLSCGYVPVVGDQVVAQVIESEQNRCTWRALKLIPDYMTRVFNPDITNMKMPTFEENYPGINIKGLDVSFNELTKTKAFSIIITNSSDEEIILKSVQFLNRNSQCKVINNLNMVHILPEQEYKIPCECCSRNMGSSREFLILHFENFTLGKWVNVNVLLTQNRSHQSFEQKPRAKVNFESGNQMVRGQKNAGPRFLVVQLPLYALPQKLFDVVSKYDYKDTIIVIEELKVMKPVLFNNLSYTIYEDKFHTLLHLDEIANLIAVQNYDQDKACFITNGEYLMLEIENLSERRPSIVLGDKIIATDPMNINKIDFEGVIHKVGAKHVFLKFSSLFHDTYNGEDYSIKVVPGRSSYRKLHHAVHLAVRNLGPDLLFPMKLSLRDPQVDFSCDNIVLTAFTKNGNSNNTCCDTTDPVLKLEWYNQKLNLPQKNAVKNILWGKARPLPYIIFGPPGTGKTVTIIETVLQIIRLIPQSRLMISAPSNSAADLIALRLIDSGILKPGDLVRLVSYNYALSEAIPVKLIPYCASGSQAKDGTSSSEVTERGIQLGLSKTMLGRHRITVSTCTAAGQLFTMGFSRGHFSHIIVDEAAQAAEPDVMIPLSFLDKMSGQVILAGDPMQLGPVIICKIAEECGLNESYLERLINRFPYVRDPEGFQDSYGYDPRLVTKLVYNYRSLPAILGLYSSLFYNNDLIATVDDNSSPEADIVNKLEEILPKTKCDHPSRVVFHGVEGDNYQTADSPSWYNPYEVAQVFYYVNELYRIGLTSTNIGIITPYTKQVKEIRSLLIEAEFDIPKIGTVEEFQGQEFDVIILSTVRSSQGHISSHVRHSLGFVASPKRLNVGVSRAKSLLIVIGNPNVLCSDTYWRSVVQYCMENGSYIGCDLPP